MAPAFALHTGTVQQPSSSIGRRAFMKKLFTLEPFSKHNTDE